MKTNLKLVAGGIAGLFTAIGLMVGLVVWASASETPAAHEPVSEPAVEPVPVPALDTDLATTHRAAVPEPIAEPAPEPEPPSFEPTLAEGPVRLRRLIVSTGVERHEPIGVTNTILVGAQPRVYAFVDAVNETGDPVELEVTFEPASGESAGHVSLDVPAHTRRWRTWAWTRHVYEPGAWEVVVRAPDGQVIARRPFDVIE